VQAEGATFLHSLPPSELNASSSSGFFSGGGGGPWEALCLAGYSEGSVDGNPNAGGRDAVVMVRPF